MSGVCEIRLVKLSTGLQSEGKEDPYNISHEDNRGKGEWE